MKKIKFRVFYDNKMQPCEVSMDDYIHIFDQDEGKFVIIGAVGAGRVLKCIEVMQFTTILDKNNKEIYENDIVDMWKPDDGFVRRGKVIFQHGAFVLYVPSNERFYFLEDPMTFVVIGNVYENQERLDDTK